MSFRNIGLLAFVLCNFFQMFAEENTLEDVKKSEDLCTIQVNPSDIFLQHDGMYYIPQTGSAIKVTTLQFDKGTYIVTAPKTIIEDVLGVWWCYNCQHYNSKFSLNCMYCGIPR